METFQEGLNHWSRIHICIDCKAEVPEVGVNYLVSREFDKADGPLCYDCAHQRKILSIVKDGYSL